MILVTKSLPFIHQTEKKTHMQRITAKNTFYNQFRVIYEKKERKYQFLFSLKGTIATNKDQ
jgi:uridine phosphorylase